MENIKVTVPVKMCEIKVIENNGGALPSVLKTTLGSCVGVILSDEKKGIHGLAHIMLPERIKKDNAVGKYADTAIPAILEKMERKGSRKIHIRAYLTGGACMFASSGDNDGISSIGNRNISAARNILESMKIPIVFDETGGNSGRTIIFDGEIGKVTVNTLNKFKRSGNN